MWLPDSEKRLTASLVVSTQYRRVTDGQTDILSQRGPPYAYAWRSRNCLADKHVNVKAKT